MTPRAFAKEIKAALAPYADAQRAPAMRAYMRDQFEFLGVPTPQRRQAVLPVFKRLESESADHLLACAQILWATLLKAARAHTPQAQATMDAALQHESLWVRRVAMIHQLGWRDHTDETRLFGYARSLAAESDFFIRKAIGWAFRDYAWHAPQAVSGFLSASQDILSPLTLREAAEHLPPIR